MLPSLAVCLSLECKASQRELTSRLLSDLITKRVFNEGDMMTAFNRTFVQLPELILDTPEAPQVTPTCVCTHIFMNAQLNEFILFIPEECCPQLILSQFVELMTS